MKTKRLSSPAKIKDKDIQILKKQVLKYLEQTVYVPLLKTVPALTMKSVQNAADDALSAIKDGRITFYRGEFKGIFTAGASRSLKSLGAKWDAKTRTWRIPLNSLPNEYISEINKSQLLYKSYSTNVLEALSEISHDIESKSVDFTRFYDTTLFKLDKDLTKQIDAITVGPQLTENEIAGIAKEYGENMELQIKNFAQEEILSLRKKVEQNFYAGNRYENLIETIKTSYGVSDSKAQFLAQQETNLLSMQYQEQRFTNAGSEAYVWRCVKGNAKHPVRPAHKALDGKTIRWDSPPVVDQKSGRKAHAGEDFRCRCTREIIFKF